MSMIYLCFPRVWIDFPLSIFVDSIGLSLDVEVLLAWAFISVGSGFEFAPFLLIFEV